MHIENIQQTDAAAGLMENPAISLARIREAISNVQAVAREKQRSVESLIQSAQATHDKVFAKLNAHIDHLELEKVRFQKVAEDHQAANEELARQMAAAGAVIKDLEEKAAQLVVEKNELAVKIASLSEEVNQHVANNKELAAKNDALMEARKRLDEEKTVLAKESEKERARLADRLDQIEQEKAQLSSQLEALSKERAEDKAKLLQITREIEKNQEEMQARLEAADAARIRAENKAQKIQEAWDRLEL